MAGLDHAESLPLLWRHKPLDKHYLQSRLCHRLELHRCPPCRSVPYAMRTGQQVLSVQSPSLSSPVDDRACLTSKQVLSRCQGSTSSIMCSVPRQIIFHYAAMPACQHTTPAVIHCASACGQSIAEACFSPLELDLMVSDILLCAGDVDMPLNGLEDLEFLVLSNASLNGTLPLSWPEQLPQLRLLDLAFNDLHGGLPAGACAPIPSWHMGCTDAGASHPPLLKSICTVFLLCRGGIY